MAAKLHTPPAAAPMCPFRAPRELGLLSVTPLSNTAFMTLSASPAPSLDTSAATNRLRAVQAVSSELATSRPASGCSVAEFSECVRRIVAVARSQGLNPPAFRSPPRLPGLDRSVQRRAKGAVMIAIRRGERPFAAIQGDIIEGVVVANRLSGEQAEQFRRVAWSGLESQHKAAATVQPAQSVQRSSPLSSLGSAPRPRRRPVPEELADQVA
jgi:hypothetical protein